MQAQTKNNQTHQECFIFGSKHSKVFCEKHGDTGNIMHKFQLCNKKVHDLCSVQSHRLMSKHNNGPHLKQHYKTDKQSSDKLQIVQIIYVM
jgi:hypothetical protein